MATLENRMASNRRASSLLNLCVKAVADALDCSIEVPWKEDIMYLPVQLRVSVLACLAFQSKRAWYHCLVDEDMESLHLDDPWLAGSSAEERCSLSAFFASKCPNIKSLELRTSAMPLHHLSGSLQKLWTGSLVHLCAHSLQGGLSDAQLLAVVDSCANIHTLDLTCGSLLDSSCAYLARLPNLTTLKLFSCDRLSDRGVVSLAALKSLKVLRLDTSGKISNDMINRLCSPDGCLGLQDLQLVRMMRLTHLHVQLPHLTKLQINSGSARSTLDTFVLDCPLLDDLRLQLFPLRPELVAEQLRHLQVLTRLCIEEYQHDQTLGYVDPILDQLSVRGPQCTHLTLTTVVGFSRSALVDAVPQLCNLKSLCLRRCVELDDDVITSIQTSAPLLELLDVNGHGMTSPTIALRELTHFSGASSDTLIGICVDCPRLDHLDLSQCPALVSPTLNVPSVKSVYLSRCPLLTAHDLVQLMDCEMQLLAVAGCVGMTVDELERALLDGRCLQTLTSVNYSGLCAA